MAQLWGGRFTKDTDQLVYNFNASISFDQKFFHQDIRGQHCTYRNACKAEDIDRRRKGCDRKGADRDPGRCGCREAADHRVPMKISTALWRQI